MHANENESTRALIQPLFDESWYLKTYPEAGESGYDPISHYLAVGAEAGCNPHPLFDTAFYYRQNPDVKDAGANALVHFMENGYREGRKPHPLFDTDFYCRENPDVKSAGSNALLHYLEHGGGEGRDPHPWFDSSYYLENNPDVVAAGVNPLRHYVETGGEEGRHPHPLFRAEHWAAQRPEAPRGVGSLIDFAEELDKPGGHPFVALGLREFPRRRGNGAVVGLPGVNLIGWPRLEIGLAECLREIARALDATNIPFGIRDVSQMRPFDPGDDSVNGHIVAESCHRTNLFIVNADNMRYACGRLGLEDVRDRFNIAMWAWELAEFPDAWRPEMAVVDEFWAFSTFVQDCLAAKAEVPVVHMPLPVTISPGAGLTRDDFGIPNHRFAFLLQFDFSAFIDRKNPFAAIRAFRKAFPRGGSAATLAIKTNNSERYPEALRALTETVGGDPDVVLLHDTFRRDKVMSLMQACDAFVSLHRSEGFGRSLAEAMLMGKPVVATNYSGNTEFMRPDNSCLVNYTLAPVKEGQYPQAQGQVWAEADTEHAAWHMRRLVQDREYRNSISAAARETIAEGYNLGVTGAKYARRLRLLGLI